MNVLEIDPRAHRQQPGDPEVEPMFVQRWSPRALSGQALTESDLRRLIEAARWAPSCFNAQPWRFAYTLAGTETFDALFDTLVEGNRAWVAKAGALVAVASRTRYEHNDKPAATHSFDAGAAWMSMALQATVMGLVAHGMMGFDQEAARRVLSLPDLYDLPAIIALGYPGAVEDLPEAYRERETPSSRKPLNEILFQSTFSEIGE